MPSSSGLDPVVQKFLADNSDTIAKIREMKREFADLAAMAGKAIRIDADVSGALAKIAAVKGELAGLGDKTVTVTVKYVTVGDKPGAGAGLGGDGAAMIRELRDISASMDMATSSMGRMEDHLVAIKRDVADSSADLMMQTQMLRDNAEAHNRAATAVAALAAARRGSSGGGGGVALAAAAGAAAGAGGGGGGGGFIPWAGGGWQAVRFWGMMGAEVASTVVPALVAAGAAALVGAQGFEQLQGRAQAVYTVSEALGASLHMTAGQFVGVGNALQNAQNLATGGVYGLAGAGINLLRTGAGGGLLQQGVGTIAMLDRAAASALLNVQSQGTGARLAAALSGGTNYLREFGAIGANVGSTLLNVAPFLPGVGSDLLGTLTAATGGLAAGTGALAKYAPEALGGFFSYEAASRWGPALLGGKGLIGRMLGLRGVGGLGGLLGKVGLGGAGDFLAGLTGPEIGIPAIFAYLAAQGLTAKNVPEETIANLQAGIGQAGFTGAWQPLAHALTVTSALAQTSGATVGQPGAIGISSANITADPRAAYRASVVRTHNAAIYAAAAQGFAQQMGELVGAGPQLVSALQGVGLKGVSLADAFQAAQSALLDIPHSFGPGGKVNAQALQQLRDFAVTIGPMTQSGGAFGAAVAGTQIMSSTQMKNLATVNQAMDSMTQIMSAGPAGMAVLAAMQGAAPAGMAKALTSFSSPAGAAAWTSFASTTQPSIISQMQQYMDQMRTGLTLGALTQGQAAGLAGYQLQQFLPMARQSPAALAMLMQQGAQMGITGYYDPSKSQAQNYQAAINATKAIADNSKQAGAATNTMVEKLSNLPVQAQQLALGTSASIQAQRVAAASADAIAIQQKSLKGGIATSAVSDLVNQIKAAGVSGTGAIKQSLDAILSQAGVSGAMRIKIETQVQPPKIPAPPKGPTVMYESHVHPPAAPAPPKGGTVNYPSHVQAPVAPPPPKGGVVVYSSVVLPPSTPAAGVVGSGGVRFHGQSGFRVPGYGGGDIWGPAMLEPGELVVPKDIVAAGGVDHLRGRIPGFAGGGIVPGGNLFQSLLFWGQLQADLGQIMQQAVRQFAASVQDFARIPSLGPGAGGSTEVRQIVQNTQATATRLGGVGAWLQAAAKGAPGGISVGLVHGLDSTGGGNIDQLVKKVATSLVKQIQQEIQYAQQVSQATSQGLFSFLQAPSPGSQVPMGVAAPGTKGYNAANWNAYVAAYANDALPGGPNAPQQPQSVQQQMQAYLQDVRQFGKDIQALSKQHLAKGVISQLVAQGPVQGDALAQSILSGPGGVKSVNSLWSQIQKASNALGAFAAMAQFGGKLSPGLGGGTFVGSGGVAVTVNVNMGGGVGGNLGTLTTQQINQIVKQIESKLLQQAQRNRKTGTALKNKPA